LTARARKTRISYRWERLDDEALLRLRFRDLGLKFAGSPVAEDARRLVGQLERRGIAFKPHFWFSTDWFSPDGVPGIAVPFFLGHPRLVRLERRMMGQAEGGNRPWRVRLLRHELGHVVDTAFGLRRRGDWRRVFGNASARYSLDYAVQPRSKSYVLNLEHWYAQSHPTEDFAETFAVWLGPKARWRAAYAGWPALAKLEFVDGLMAELAGRPPSKRDRWIVAPLKDNHRTLREHYRRRAHLNDSGELRYDSWLTRVLPPRADPTTPSAERLLTELKPQLTRALLRRSHAHPYVIFQVLRAVRRRARHLDLGFAGPKREVVQRVTRLHERILADFLRRNEETYFL
jgi:Putative zinc-binding metallo-peptidase